MIVANAALALAAIAVWEGAMNGVAALPIHWPRGTFRIVHGVVLLATIGAGFATYVTCLRLLHVRGAEELWELPRRVLRRFVRPAR
jgi:hypothetical protein